MSFIPSSFVSPSKQPRCVHRRQVPSPSILPYHSVRFNSSRDQAPHASYADVVRRDMQIFSPCPPRSAGQVSLRRPGRCFAPYQRAKAQAHHHHDSDDDADADSCSTWHTVCHRRAKNSTGKVPLSRLAFPVNYDCPTDSKNFPATAVLASMSSTPPQDSLRMSVTSHHQFLSLLTRESQFVPRSSVPA